MSKHVVKWLAVALLATAAITLSLLAIQAEPAFAQIPTGTIATVTSTPTGPLASVRPDINEDFVNVRTGPNTLYPSVGLLLIGQQAKVIGKSSGGTWLLIEYAGVTGGQGWVYAPYMNLTPGTDPPIVEPPPTPSPQVTQTIDPTMAAQFIVTSAPTRLPTFTPPPPLVIATFEADPGFSGPGSIPIGLVIVVLFALGIVTGLISLLQGR